MSEETVSLTYSDELAVLIDAAFLEAQCRLADGKPPCFIAAMKEGEIVLRDMREEEDAWEQIPDVIAELSPSARAYALVYAGEAGEGEEHICLLLMECGEKGKGEGYFFGLPYQDLGFGPEFEEMVYLGESDDPWLLQEER